LCFCAAACRISKDVEVVVDPAGAPAGASTAAAALSVEAAGKGSKQQVGKTQDDEQQKAAEPEVKVTGQTSKRVRVGARSGFVFGTEVACLWWLWGLL
jgi:hypothetical protein